MLTAIQTVLALSASLLAWIRAERQELMPIVGAAMTVLVVAGGMAKLTIDGDELRKRVWECQDEIGDRSQEGWSFCLDLLSKPEQNDDGC
jgi:hypothetical protein